MSIDQTELGPKSDPIPSPESRRMTHPSETQGLSRLPERSFVTQFTDLERVGLSTALVEAPIGLLSAVRERDVTPPPRDRTSLARPRYYPKGSEAQAAA